LTLSEPAIRLGISGLALEKLPSMLLKRWVLLLDQGAALASQFLTRMDPRPWPGPRLSKNLAKPRGVYVRCTGSRTCEGIHFFDVAKERGSWRQGRSRKGPPAA